MKIDCSRQLCERRTVRQTDIETLAFLELLSEPKKKRHHIRGADIQQSNMQELYIKIDFLFLTLSLLSTLQIGGLSSITGSASSPYIPSSDFSPLPPLRSQISVPGSVTSSMFRPGQTSVGNGLGSRSLASMLASTSGGGLHESLAHYTTTTASPLFDPMPGVSLPSTTPSHHLSSGGMMGGYQGGGGDPLLDNSNLCDILMLERALETEAAMGGGMSAAREALSQSLGPGVGTGENRVDMLEIPGKGRCYVYLAR